MWLVACLLTWCIYYAVWIRLVPFSTVQVGFCVSVYVCVVYLHRHLLQGSVLHFVGKWLYYLMLFGERINLCSGLPRFPLSSCMRTALSRHNPLNNGTLSSKIVCNKYRRNTSPFYLCNKDSPIFPAPRKTSFPTLFCLYQHYVNNTNTNCPRLLAVIVNFQNENLK